LWGCSERIAGGTTGVETTNGIRVLRPDGAPAAGIPVRLRPARWLSGQALPSDASAFSGVTDSGGRMALRLPASGRWRIEAQTQGLAAQGLDSAAGETLLRLAPWAGLQGRSAPFDTVGLAGLDRRAVADSLGRFRFDSLPSGMLDAVGRDGRHGWVALEPESQAQAGTLRSDDSSVLLLDDFEDGNLRHRWAARVGGGWWYATQDSGVTCLQAGVETLGGDSGKDYAAAFSFATGSNSAWANFGVALGNPDTIHLEGLDAVRFRARGNGRVGVYLSSPSGVLSAWIDLTSEWGDLRIPIDSFAIASGSPSGATRPSILASVRNISWQFVADGEIHLDDISLEGATARSAWHLPSEP